MKDKLLDWMDSLPCFTEWKVSNLEFSGYKTIYPIELIWRDALEVVKQLFSNPIFANHMTFVLHHVNVRDQREYGDYMSADMAWKIQVCSPYSCVPHRVTDLQFSRTTSLLGWPKFQLFWDLIKLLSHDLLGDSWCGPWNAGTHMMNMVTTKNMELLCD